MSSDGNEFEYDDEDESQADADAPDASGDSPEDRPPGFRNWMAGRRGWIMLVGITLAQALFATIMIMLRSNVKPMTEYEHQNIRALAVEMLGYEVAIKQIYQSLPGRGGRRMTIGLDIVLVLGQLPAEQVEGSPRPTGEEMDVFIQAIQGMEERIRSQVNFLLQKIPVADYGTTDVYKVIKDAVREYINDSLEGLNFGTLVRPGIDKRRVTEVLLPMFVRMTM
jgi:hypothetical protein